MMEALVVFGIGEIAQLAHWYFTHDTPYRIAAFTVDAEYVKSPTLLGAPVIPFHELPGRFAPSEYSCFIALSYSRLNALRREKYLAMKSLGYTCASYVSPHATMLNDGRVGENCFILEDNTIQPYACIGHNVTLWSGNHIGHHATIHDHCFLASQVVVSGGVEIGEACFIGVNATLRDHIRVGEGCVIGAGALLMGDTEPGGVYAVAGTERSRVPSSRLRKI